MSLALKKRFGKEAVIVFKPESKEIAVEETANYIADLAQGFPAQDFVEVDGFHEGIWPKNDIDSTITKIKKNGVIYIDDYNYVGVKNAVESTDWSNFDVYIISDIFYAVKK